MDPFILLAPLLFLPIVMLLAFVGCTILFAPADPTEPTFEVTFFIGLLDDGWPAGPFTVDLQLERGDDSFGQEFPDVVGESVPDPQGNPRLALLVVKDGLPAGAYEVRIQVEDGSGNVVVQESNTETFLLELSDPPSGGEPVAEPLCFAFRVPSSADGEVDAFADILCPQ